jgi:Uma2 family endonuclease
MGEHEIRTRRWKRVEYDKLIEIGFFQPGEKIELLGGQLMVAEPQHTLHAASIRLVDEALRAAFGHGWDVRSQLPIALDDESEPEPDVAVVPGGPRDYLHDHPARPVLIVEVAESSLRYDRRVKGSFYARARLEDYWIVNVVDRVLEVYRDPAEAPGTGTRHGRAYREVRRLESGSTIAPLARPGVDITVAELLP